MAGKSWELARVCQKILAGKEPVSLYVAGKRRELARVCQKILAGKNRFHFKWREKVGNLHESAKNFWRARTGFTLNGGKKLGTCMGLPENSGEKEPVSF